MSEEGEKISAHEAISSILKTLDPLDDESRKKVLSAVHAFLGTSYNPQHTVEPKLPEQTGAVAPFGHVGVPKDIRSLREEKQPKSDIETVVVMAYYLRELAAAGERKASVTAEDVEAYFPQMGAKLPAKAGQTLINGKNAGYFVSQGSGRFALNPVGLNLVTHTLPRTAGRVARKSVGSASPKKRPSKSKR
jgi:hypothetical protein